MCVVCSGWELGVGDGRSVRRIKSEFTTCSSTSQFLSFEFRVVSVCVCLSVLFFISYFVSTSYIISEIKCNWIHHKMPKHIHRFAL